MRLADHLNKEQLDKLKRISKSSVSRSANPKVSFKSNEELTERDLHELMGINRDTYKRGEGGAIKSNRK